MDLEIGQKLLADKNAKKSDNRSNQKSRKSNEK